MNNNYLKNIYILIINNKYLQISLLIKKIYNI